MMATSAVLVGFVLLVWRVIVLVLSITTSRSTTVCRKLKFRAWGRINIGLFGEVVFKLGPCHFIDHKTIAITVPFLCMWALYCIILKTFPGERLLLVANELKSKDEIWYKKINRHYLFMFIIITMLMETNRKSSKYNMSLYLLLRQTLAVY